MTENLDSYVLTLKVSTEPRNIAVSLNLFLRISCYFQFYSERCLESFGEVVVELPVLRLKAIGVWKEHIYKRIPMILNVCKTNINQTLTF